MAKKKTPQKTNPDELTLEDLSPLVAELELSTFPGETFHLNKFTLKQRIWATKKWGAEKIQEAFAASDPEVIAEITWALLEEKERFENSFDKFTESVVSMSDMYNLQTALLTTVGLSEPVIKALQDPKMQAQLLRKAAKQVERTGR